MLGAALVFIPRAANAASLTALGNLPGGGFWSYATGVSADGTTVVGGGSASSGDEAFRWTATGGMVGLGDFQGGDLHSRAIGVSADGSIVVCEGTDASGPKAFRWTEVGGMTLLENPPGQPRPTGVSADGNTVVGFRNIGGSFLWTAAGGMTALPASAYGVSADGNTVVGQSYFGDLFTAVAFRWTKTGGLVVLGDLPGGATNSAAYGASSKGDTVVGEGRTDSGQTAFRWTSIGGMTALGSSPSGVFGRVARAVSGDGSTVVGFGTSARGQEAFVWTAGSGLLSLEALLIAQGLNPINYGWSVLSDATAISQDGRYVVGSGIRNGNTEAFLVDFKGAAALPPPIPLTLARTIDGMIGLEWQTEAGLIYTAYRATTPEGPWTIILTTKPIATGVKSRTMVDLPPTGQSHYYRVGKS